MHQPHLIAREKPEIFLRRLLHEIFSLNVKLPSERDFPGAELLILQIICHVKIFHLVLRVIVDHQLDRVEHCHHTRLLHLQVLADTVLQHRVIHRTLRFGHPAHIDKHPDGLRRKPPASQRCDGHQSRVVPSVYDAVLHQLLDIALPCHHICQVQLREFDLSRRILKLTLSHYPVIKRPVILKLQRTDGVRDSLDCILDRMSEIIHRIDAPLVPCVVVGHVRHPVNDRIPHIDIR